MSKEIARIEGQEPLTDQKRKQIHRDSTALYADTLAMGTRRTMQQAASLHNIKTFQTYRTEGFKSWKEYCEAIGISREYSYQYLGIARALVSSIADADADQFLFTRQYLDAIYKDSSDYFRSLTMRELYEASTRFDAHALALNGTEIHRLLPPPKDPTNEEIGDERKAKSDAADFNDHMTKALAPYGWVWNAKARRCEHADGTPLTDEEIGMITAPETAFSVFRQVGNRLDSTLDRVKDDIVRDMATYVRYAKAIPNPALDKKVWEVRNELQEKFQTVMQIIDAVISCDEKRAKEIRKHGLEAA